MEIILAELKDLNTVLKIVSTAIMKIYPRYYPSDVVDFFLQHHRKENIVRDIQQGKVYLLLLDTVPIGTATISEERIHRIFVLPYYQRKGYGSHLMSYLEEKIAIDHNKVTLSSSMPAFELYIKRGYWVKESHKIAVNGCFLFYTNMEKELIRAVTDKISYNSKIFTSISNSANGELDEKTFFHYRQSEDTIWAEYHGGSIIEGSILGKVDKVGTLDFTYQHINTKNEMKIGKCTSTPFVLPDGRIRLSEKWQWLDGDNSCGESVIEELRRR